MSVKVENSLAVRFINSKIILSSCCAHVQSKLLLKILIKNSKAVLQVSCA